MAEIYVPGAIDIMGSANQMMQFRNSQQAQQANALQMQYAAEDRARADEARKLAAGAASAERLRKQQFMDTIKGGYMPAKTAVMGPGTVQGNTPASFDPEKVKNELLRRGDLSGLVTFSNAQEQIAKQQEQEAKATGQGLINEETRAKTEGQLLTNTGTDYKNTADFIKMTNAQIDAAPNLDALKAIVMATYTPGHPMAAFNKLNKLTPEAAIAGIDGLTAQGKTLDQIKAQMSQGATAAAKNFADLAKVNAETMQIGKPAASVPTNLAKLLTEQAALPPDSPARKQYDAAINKELAVSDAAQSALGKLVTERNRLNPNDPLRAQYDAAIAKEVSSATAATIPSGYRLKPNGDLEFIPGGPADPKVSNKTTPAPVGYRYKADGSGNLEAIPGGPEAGKAMGAVAKSEDTILAAEDAVGTIDKLLKHPGFSEAVGASFGSSMIPGTDAKGAIALHNQILGTAFLDAYNTLRGTGSISEIEGTKATAAKARMDLNTSEKDYIDAATEFQNILKRGIEKEKARMQKTGGGADATSATQAKIARNVDIEHTAKQNSMSVEDTKARLRSMGYKIEGE